MPTELHSIQKGKNEIPLKDIKAAKGEKTYYTVTEEKQKLFNKGSAKL